jgi:hypothetical protein
MAAFAPSVPFLFPFPLAAWLRIPFLQLPSFGFLASDSLHRVQNYDSVHKTQTLPSLNSFEWHLERI